MGNQLVQEKIAVRYHHELSDDELNRLRGSALGKKIAQRYLLLPLTFQYYSSYHQDKYQDRTFYVTADGEPVLSFHALCHEGRLGYFHMPAEVCFGNAGSSLLDKACNRMLQEVTQIVNTEKIQEMQFAYDPYLCGAYFGNARHQTLHTCLIDLELSEEQIFSNIRKSYKSLINWGRRELQLRVMTHADADKVFFEQVKQFHIQVAGRQTRTNATWDKQFESIQAGEAYVVAAFFRDVLASVAIILHGSEEAFYGVAINNRKLMEEFPIGHYPLLAAVLHAKRIGLKRFNLNEIDPLRTDDKVDNISGFKKGFSKTLLPRTIYTVSFSKL